MEDHFFGHAEFQEVMRETQINTDSDNQDRELRELLQS